jgi:hypothetical protein
LHDFRSGFLLSGHRVFEHLNLVVDFIQGVSVVASLAVKM